MYILSAVPILLSYYRFYNEIKDKIEKTKRRMTMIIDAHLHLWKKQSGCVNGKPVFALSGGKSDFGGAIRQMMPP